jgi:murein DD-endopeptidase MepM/ murein hydrolase activator NlpD
MNRLIPLLVLAAITTSASALEVTGRWIQGGFISGTVAPGSTVRLGKAPVLVAPDGRFAFGLAFDAALATELTVVGPDGQQQRHEYSIEQRRYPESRINGLPQAMVTPPKAVLDRIAADGQAVQAARAKARTQADFKDFIWPIKGTRISGEFGSKRVLNGVPRQPHFGVDIAAPQGTPIQAPAAGLVTLAAPDLYYTGQTVIIDHGLGITTTYLHLSKTQVKVGARVGQGQIIGEVGMTGRATGPHLCWRANWHEVRFDPSLLVDAEPAVTQPRR